LLFLHLVSLSCFTADFFTKQIYFSYSSNSILFVISLAIQLFIEDNYYVIKDSLAIDLSSSLIVGFILLIFKFILGNVIPWTVNY